MTKRLFIFAAYDPIGIIDDVLLFYLNALAKLGDLVFWADSNLSEYWISKIRSIPNVRFAGASRHCEYDFGSYKRGYAWIAENGLEKYDWIYFVNDSVFGPDRDLAPILTDLEKFNGAVGMVCARDHAVPHIQSWFVGMPKRMACSQWIADFFNDVARQESKNGVIVQYEEGLSGLVTDHGYHLYAFLDTSKDMDIYCVPNMLLRRAKLPFVKKLVLRQTRYFTPKTLGALFDNTDLRRLVLNWCHKNCIALKQYKYRKYAQLRLFGVPAVTVKKHENTFKILLFGLIPIVRWARRG